MKDAPSKLYCKRIYLNGYVNGYQEFIVTVHDFYQFEEVEWNKLVQAEIKAKKFVLGQRRKSPSNCGAPNCILFARINLKKLT